MNQPRWFGHRYPTLEALIKTAEQLGALVTWADSDGEAIYISGAGEEPPVIVLPTGVRPLEEVWALAHELGHLLQHAGPRGALLYDKDEAAADRWAACALIPEDRILAYQNAHLDTFMAALARHYGPFEPGPSPDRRLAARVATIRLAYLPSRPDDSWEREMKLAWEET